MHSEKRAKSWPPDRVTGSGVMLGGAEHILDGSLSLAANDPTPQETRTNIIRMAINAYYDDKP
jgi:hypothetical protein